MVPEIKKRLKQCSGFPVPLFVRILFGSCERTCRDLFVPVPQQEEEQAITLHLEDTLCSGQQNSQTQHCQQDHLQSMSCVDKISISLLI